MMRVINSETTRSNTTVHVPPWNLLDDPTATTVNLHRNATGDTTNFEALAALHRYLPSNTTAAAADSDFLSDDYHIPLGAFSCDHFRMFDFKVKKCARANSHDWTECPYVHAGEKARRRDPRKFHYSGTACPEFRKGQCKKGDSCEFAHGVFECWLHPSRYRTQPCKDGTHCRRRVCFFAHTPDQLRVLPQISPRTTDSYDGSLSRLGSSPTSTLYLPSDSPNVNSVSELSWSMMKNLQIGKVRMSMSPTSQMGSECCSPRSPSGLRSGFSSLPSTPTRTPTRSGLDFWDQTCEEEPVMERVESGRDLRAKIYAKLSKENSLNRVDLAPGPDFGWVSELVK
ncbi:hypothetical protein ACSBR1_037717 [Camellia fascicularis]